MTIRSENIEYHHQGTTLEGQLAYDDNVTGPRPLVLVSHAWGGRSEFECTKAQKLAELGYAGFALDLYGKSILGSGPEENTKLMAPFLEDRGFLQDRLQAVIDTTAALDVVDANKTAAIGYCFGGLCVLDMARAGHKLRGVVSLHGLFAPPGNLQTEKVDAKVLALHGWDDPMVPPEQVVALAQELTSANADWQIHAYGHTTHAFTNPQANDPNHGTVYSPTADRRSWAAVKNFLAEVLD